VDSHYLTPKFYEVPKEMDPNAWTGRFVMLNFTSRINSWEGGSTGMENNAAAWLAEIAGKGARIGFFTQMGNLIGGLKNEQQQGDNENNRKMVRKIYGGNKVLNLADTNQLGKLFYDINNDPYTTTVYNTSSGAIMYAGYEKPEFFNVFLTMLTEGNVDSDVRNGNNRGFAGVIDFGVSPFGVFTDEEHPITFNVTGNAIAGFNFNTTPNSNQNIGFGLKGEGGFWLKRDNLVLSPVVAFDGRLTSNKDFYWKTGGGLTFQFSGMRWTSDDWGDLQNTGAPAGSTATYPLADYRYENNKILKYAYAQIYGSYSDQSDFDMLFRFEEQDGNLGFHEKLGAMMEMRLYNLTERNAANKLNWEAQARVSWDFNVKQFTITPYLRAYLNKALVTKFRVGAYANIIPFTCFELAYTSYNLNPNADTTVKPKSHYNGIKDAGRIELIIMLKSDDIRPQVPKRMSDWFYPSEVQHF
jgi:hypothetical protein